MPLNKILYKELVYLKEDEKRVDHPKAFPDGTVGSKDLSDAVCNALWIAQTKLEYMPYLDHGFIDELAGLVDEEPDNPFEDIFGEGTTGEFRDY